MHQIFQNQLINSDATVSSIIIYLENDIEFKKISNLRDDIKLKILNDGNDSFMIRMDSL